MINEQIQKDLITDLSNVLTSYRDKHEMTVRDSVEALTSLIYLTTVTNIKRTIGGETLEKYPAQILAGITEQVCKQATIIEKRMIDTLIDIKDFNEDWFK